MVIMTETISWLSASHSSMVYLNLGDHNSHSMPVVLNMFGQYTRNLLLHAFHWALQDVACRDRVVVIHRLTAMGRERDAAQRWLWREDGGVVLYVCCLHTFLEFPKFLQNREVLTRS